MFQEDNQNWEEQLRQRANELLARRFGSLEAEVRRLQSTVNELCERVLEQTQPTITADEAASLGEHFAQRLNAATADTERDFQARLQQAQQEAAAAARQEAETEFQALREQLEASRQEAAISVAPVAATPFAHEAQFDLLRTAIEEIDAQRTQSDALSTLVHRAAQFAPRIVFFVVKSGNAVGWKASGFTDGLNDESVRSLAVPTQANTLLREALDFQHTAVGTADSHPENSAVLGRHGTPPAARAVAVPLVVRGKAAAVLYADSGTQPGEAINTEALEALLRVTSMVIELLPVRRSTEQARPAAPAAPPPAPPPPPPAAAQAPTTQPVFYGGMGEAPPARSEAAFQAESAQTQPAFSFAPAETLTPPAAPAVEEPKQAAATTASSSEAQPPAGATAPGGANEAEVRAHNDARRFARLLVSEIKLYNEAKVAEGRRSYDLYERLKDDIDRSRQMYEKRVSPVVAAKFDYFYDELVHTLGEGDSAKLGRGCPGPTVPV